MQHGQWGRSGSIQPMAVATSGAVLARSLALAGLVLVALRPCAATPAAPVEAGAGLDPRPQSGLRLYTGT